MTAARNHHGNTSLGERGKGTGRGGRGGLAGLGTEGG